MVSVALLFLPIIAACSLQSDEEPLSPPSGFTTFRSEDFEISYPQTWVVDLSILGTLEEAAAEAIGASSISVLFFATEPSVGAQASVNVVMGPLVLPFSLDEYVAVASRNLERTGMSIDGTREEVLGNHDAVILFMSKGLFRPTQLIVVESQTAWIVTCTPNPPTAEEMMVCEHTARSFRLLG